MAELTQADKAQVERLIKDTAHLLWFYGEAATRTIAGHNTVYPDWKEYEEVPDPKWWEAQAAKFISNISELIRVISADQSPPDNPVKVTTEFGLSKKEAVSRQLEIDGHCVVIQGVMKGNGFVKLIPNLAEAIKEGQK